LAQRDEQKGSALASAGAPQVGHFGSGFAADFDVSGC
jgi:hypothetical protein